MDNIHLIIKASTKALSIKKPIQVRFLFDNPKKLAGIAAICESSYRNSKVIRHTILMNMLVIESSEYKVLDTLAHELVHASMMENNLFNDDKHHDEVFQKLCTHYESFLADIGHPVSALYNPVTDKD